MSGDALTDVK